MTGCFKHKTAMNLMFPIPVSSVTFASDDNTREMNKHEELMYEVKLLQRFFKISNRSCQQGPPLYQYYFRFS